MKRDPRHYGASTVAAWTGLSASPPHRTGRAELPHPVLTLGAWRQSVHWVWMHNSRKVSSFSPSLDNASMVGDCDDSVAVRRIARDRVVLVVTSYH